MSLQQSNLLTSWKEIANYLGKGVRTVQRWEVTLGLPVRRPDKSAYGIVQATREELDAWLASSWSPKRIEGNKQEHASNGALQICAKKLETARQIRNTHRQLVGDLHKSLQQLTLQCQTLAKELNAARSHSGNM